MKAMITADVTKSIFYGPVINMPALSAMQIKAHYRGIYKID